MRNVAKSSDENLKTLFGNVASKAGLSPAIIEKDFWVCWMLDYLFGRSPWTRQLAGRHMQNMIFGDKPSFAEILDCIRKIEAEIHAL